jgi:hypothetical protein
MATTWAMATKMRMTGVKEGEGDGGNSDGDGDEGDGTSYGDGNNVGEAAKCHPLPR